VLRKNSACLFGEKQNGNGRITHSPACIEFSRAIRAFQTLGMELDYCSLSGLAERERSKSVRGQTRLEDGESDVLDTPFASPSIAQNVANASGRQSPRPCFECHKSDNASETEFRCIELSLCSKRAQTALTKRHTDACVQAPTLGLAYGLDGSLRLL
jgi:hypothetical protein